MKAVTPILCGLALLLVVAQTHAEYRTVLIHVKQDKDKKPSVSIYSDEQRDQKSAVSVAEAVKVLSAMQGWRSSVGVYVTSDGKMSRADLKQLLVAITDNGWLDLVYFGDEIPKVVGDHFLQGKAPK
jgi:hypothetical protein